MKTKLTISILLGLLTFAFIYNKTENFNREEAIPVPASNVEIKEYKLSKSDQQKRMEYLSSVQANRYECESDYNKIPSGTIIEDITVFGKGAKVIYCKAGIQRKGYVVKGLIKKNIPVNVNNKWENDTMHNWYIKPRMRIKQELIYPLIQGYNEENLHTKICRLEIVNTKGKVVKEVEYEGKHFLEKNPEDECRVYYSGNYKETFGFMLMDSIIYIDGKELNPDGMASTSKSKLDYRIYWYGETDIWLDYIDVINDAADELLTGRYKNMFNVMEPNNISQIDALVSKLRSYSISKFAIINQ